MKILMGIIGVGIGIAYTIYSDKITETVGNIRWAEDKLGAGGTYKLQKMIGVLIVVISILWMTGTFQWLLKAMFGSLFGVEAEPAPF